MMLPPDTDITAAARGARVRPGLIARLALALTDWTERWVPDAFIFALYFALDSQDGVSRAAGRFGAASAVAAMALYGALQAVDGVALKQAVNAWASAPETEKTAHYFFAQAYNFKLDQKWVSDMLRTQIKDIFLQDMAMVKAQQHNMDLGSSPVVNLGQDKAWVAMRQIVDRLVKEELQPAKAA